MARLKNVEDIYPLSPMQGLMLTHALADPAADASFTQVAYEIDGPLDADAFAAAWQVLVNRHTALRTAFLWDGLKDPVQAVRKEAALECAHLDWRDTPAAGLVSRLRDWLQADRTRGFDLTRAPLMRIALMQLAPDRHVFVWSSHHLIIDRWCIGILLDELQAIYHAGSGQSSLPPARPYREYIAWLKQQSQADLERFWRDDVTRWPAPPSFARRLGAQAGVANTQVSLSVAATQQVRSFAQAGGLTLSSVCMGAWALALGWAKGGDALLGLTISGRPATLDGVEHMVGCFVQNLPLRTAIGDEPLLAWLRALQNRQLDIQDHGHVAPLALQQWAGEAGSATWFDTLFVYQAPVRASEGALRLRPRQGSLTAAYPFTVSVSDEADGLLLWASYDQAFFSNSDAVALLDAVKRVLARICEAPHVSPAALMHELGRPPALVARTRAGASGDSHLHDRIREHYHPVTATETRLLALWRTALGKRDIGVEDSFFENGGASLQAMRLMTLINRAFDKSLPVTQLYQAPSARKFAALISEGAQPDAWHRLVAIQPSGGRLPLFLVHHGAGGTYGYANIAKYMHADQPLFGLQESGWEPGESMPESVVAMAADYVRELRTVQTEGPYIIGGFCFGGVVAYEMAQQLRQAGHEVALLLLIDALAPVDWKQRRRALPSGLSRYRARMQQMSASQRVRYLAGRVVNRARWAVLHPFLKARDVTWRMMDRVGMRLGLPIDGNIRGNTFLNWNGRLQDAYSPQPYVGHTVLVQSHQDHLPDGFGWQDLVPIGVEVHKVNTRDHLEMMMEPHAREFAEIVQRAMDAAVDAAHCHGASAYNRKSATSTVAASAPA